MGAAALVRAATPEDARPVAEVHVTSWRHAYRGLFPTTTSTGCPSRIAKSMWLGAFADPDPKSGALVAEATGRRGVRVVRPEPRRGRLRGDGRGPRDLRRAFVARHGRGSRALRGGRPARSVTRVSRGRPCGCSRRTLPPAASTRRPAGAGTARSARTCSTARTSRSSGTRWICRALRGLPVVPQHAHHELVVPRAVVPRVSAQPAFLDEARLPVRADRSLVVGEHPQGDLDQVEMAEAVVDQRPDGVLPVALAPVGLSPIQIPTSACCW